MTTKLIDIIAGARPNFMKIAPIIRAIKAREAAGGPLRYRLIHTGQHYDAKMSGDFFTQLGIPQPDVNLEVGSGTQAEQASSRTASERIAQLPPTAAAANRIVGTRSALRSSTSAPTRSIDSSISRALPASVSPSTGNAIAPSSIQ